MHILRVNLVLALRGSYKSFCFEIKCTRLDLRGTNLIPLDISGFSVGHGDI